MSLENLSTGSKKTIVIIALVVIIGLKIYGFIQTKPTVLLIVALAIVASITDPSVTSANDQISPLGP